MAVERKVRLIAMGSGRRQGGGGEEDGVVEGMISSISVFNLSTIRAFI
jgi:hypothetical protein